jgi:hypothetical protein
MTANPRYDARTVLDRLPPLSDFFTRDENPPQRIGSAWFAFCPFHSEKTRSCQVNDDKGKFHCYGCGAHGDVMDYWQHTRHHNFQEALAALASIAGVAPGEWTPRRTTSAPRPAPVEAPVVPLSSSGLEKWTGACAQLAASPTEISRIAAWRGIDPEVVAWAARSGLMGTYSYFSHPREAFLVEGIGESGRIPVSVHVRLAPGSPGNADSKKASWRYDPPGVGSWPFMVGDPATSEHIFILEGQWDVLALISIMGWHHRWPSKVAAFGLRGATSISRLLRHTINPHAYIFTFCDADAAGEKWYDPGGFMDQLAARTNPNRVHGFCPSEDGADFNDLVKSGLIDRNLIISHIRPKLPQPRMASVIPAFTTWCRAAKRHAEDPAVRNGASYVAADKARPGARKPFAVWQKHWSRQSLPDHLMASLLATWEAYEADRRRILSSIQ